MLKSFIADVYRPWQVANRKTGAETIRRLEVAFAELLSRKLSEITSWHGEKWRTRRRENGTTAATINRDVTALKAALNRGFDWDSSTQCRC